MSSSIKASTQEHLDIFTIKNHLVYLKDGSVALVLQTTAINFYLLSEEEQDATIYTYAALLNSLSFPIQILIQFVKSLVKENRVLEKKFYIIIPFSFVEIGVTTKTFNPFSKNPQKPSFDLDYITEKASLTLYPRRDHLIRQFARIGLKVAQLTTPQLINLFSNIYNPYTGNIVNIKPQTTSENSIKRTVFSRPSST